MVVVVVAAERRDGLVRRRCAVACLSLLHTADRPLSAMGAIYHRNGSNPTACPAHQPWKRDGRGCSVVEGGEESRVVDDVLGSIAPAAARL